MTKAELAGRILRAIGVNTRYSDADPTQVQDLLVSLEDWMLSENGIGRRLGWNTASDTSNPNPNEEANIPQWAVLGVTYGAAEMACAYFDKQYTPSMARLAHRGMRTIVNRTVEAQSVQYPSRFPRGHSAAHPYGPHYFHPDNRIVTNNDYLSDEGDDPVTTP